MAADGHPMPIHEPRCHDRVNRRLCATDDLRHPRITRCFFAANDGHWWVVEHRIPPGQPIQRRLRRQANEELRRLSGVLGRFSVKKHFGVEPDEQRQVSILRIIGVRQVQSAPQIKAVCACVLDEFLLRRRQRVLRANRGQALNGGGRRVMQKQIGSLARRLPRGDEAQAHRVEHLEGELEGIRARLPQTFMMTARHLVAIEKGKHAGG